MSSLEVSILFRLSELGRRFGLRAADCDGYISPPSEHGRGDFYELYFPLIPNDPDKDDRFSRMMEALGSKSGQRIQVQNLDELDDRLELALAKAPRSRAI